MEVAWRDAAPTGGAVRGLAPTDRLRPTARRGEARAAPAYLPGRAATHLHVFAGELRRGSRQLSLFDPPDPRLEALAGVKEAVNAKFGRFKLRSASTLHLPAVYADPANDFDTCDVRGKICF